MAEAAPDPEVQPGDVGDDEETPGYKAPKQVDLETLQNLDADDESLVKYKQALLGNAGELPKDKTGPNVVVEKFCILSKDREKKDIDLTGDLTKLKSNPVVIKEGTEFKIEIQFKVNYEIVAGLKYMHAIYRKGIRVDKSGYMVGSYGPKPEVQTWSTPYEEAPKGILGRGHYTLKSRFTDDDKNDILSWEWSFDIKKDWE